MPLFDRYLIVDWSARKSPHTGKDSIWLGYADQNEFLDCEGGNNPSTRQKAMVAIKSICLDAIKDRQRLFIGFDFGFGYAAGAAKKITGKASWRELWRCFAERFPEPQSEAANRFFVADFFNREKFQSKGPFWRYPGAEAGTKNKKGRLIPDLYPHLPYKKPDFQALGIAERRHCETSIPRAKSNWELVNPGSVGSQTLLGIASLGRLIEQPAFQNKISVWPFDTKFTDGDGFKNITLAEVYPSAFTLAYPYNKEEPIDKAQVNTLAHGFACLDKDDRFDALLQKPDSLTDEILEQVLSEEGWIVGVSNQFDLLKDAIQRSGQIT